ncbi:hypothetical protein I4U23_020074 [Adineta vaga]|nr:hypothetical protein I4U23_020074 [Adineta vaga]
MSKFKSLKQKFLQSSFTEKHDLTSNNHKPSTISLDRSNVDENHINILTQWLEQLNQEKLITITDQNDIVIMPGGKNDQAQQIFINCNDVDTYMKAKRDKLKINGDEADMINMIDIAQMLLDFDYVKELSGQLSFMAYTMKLDSKELEWLISIIHDARPNSQTYETDIKLFDGEMTQLLSIPYEHMSPTEDVRTVATYLFQNGHIRYDIDSGTYVYRYIEPDVLLDEKTKSPERRRQHHLLSFHLRQIHVDKQNKRIMVEFVHEPNHHLVLPVHWYYRAEMHNFDRDYIIDILLANGGIIDRDTFIFMNEVYALRDTHKITTTSIMTPSTPMKTLSLSMRQKHDLIRYYVDLIIENDGAKQDETSELVLLENPTDGCHLNFTLEDSHFIRQNQFQRQDVIHLLVKNAQIKQDKSHNWFLYYNNQYIKLPSSIIPSSSTVTSDERSSFSIQDLSQSLGSITGNNIQSDNSFEQYHNIIDYMYRHGLITWDKDANLIRLHFTDQTLLLPLNHLRSILDPNVLESPANFNDILPFQSRQLSQWLLNNSCMNRRIF